MNYWMIMFCFGFAKLLSDAIELEHYLKGII